MKMLSLKKIAAFALTMFLVAACSSLAPLAPPSPTSSPSATATSAAPTVGTAVGGSAVPLTVVPIFGTPAPQPTTRVTSSPTIPPATESLIVESKFRLLAKFGTPFFCDPDLYPIARPVTDEIIAQRIAEIQKDTITYQALLQHIGLSSTATLSIEQKRAVYAEFKQINAIVVESAGANFNFSLRDLENDSVFAIQGTLDASGNITITSKQPGSRNCPICLDGATLIDTPNGEIRVRDLTNGMPVWTTDARGARRVAIILATVKRDLPFAYTLLHLVLADGREITVSPAHPTSDGRSIGALAVGDLLDGSRIARVETIARDVGATYDLLPSGETGTYWANGILLKSTLAR